MLLSALASVLNVLNLDLENRARAQFIKFTLIKTNQQTATNYTISHDNWKALDRRWFEKNNETGQQMMECSLHFSSGTDLKQTSKF